MITFNDVSYWKILPPPKNCTLSDLIKTLLQSFEKEFMMAPIFRNRVHHLSSKPKSKMSENHAIIKYFPDEWLKSIDDRTHSVVHANLGEVNKNFKGRISYYSGCANAVELNFIGGPKLDFEDSIDFQIRALLALKMLNFSLVNHNSFDCLQASIFNKNSDNFIYGNLETIYILESIFSCNSSLEKFSKSRHFSCLSNLKELIKNRMKAGGGDPLYKGFSCGVMEKILHLPGFQLEQLLSQIECGNLDRSLIKRKKKPRILSRLFRS